MLFLSSRQKTIILLYLSHTEWTKCDEGGQHLSSRACTKNGKVAESATDHVYGSNDIKSGTTIKKLKNCSSEHLRVLAIVKVKKCLPTYATLK